MMKILCLIHLFTCIWILVGNVENRYGQSNWLEVNLEENDSLWLNSYILGF
jgi:hypothetical protein